MKLTVISIFLIVTAAALVGMVMGGAFGYAAGWVAPTFFATLIPWETLEPIGTATVLGAIVGVLLGGGLGVFGVVVQFLSQWLFRHQAGH